MRVLELFSGIGGMHYACKEAGIPLDNVVAIDVNTNANMVYKHNFPGASVICRNIQSLTPDEINRIAPDIVLMSPPCQPFTRVGLKRDLDDARSCALLHVIHLISNLPQTVQYIMLENVKGFEESEARSQLLLVLQQEGFCVQEFLLSPVQFCIPNSRLRYYLLAKRSPLKFCFQTQPIPLQEFPVSFDKGNTTSDILMKLNSKFRCLADEDVEIPSEAESDQIKFCFTISHVLETKDLPQIVLEELLLPDKVLGKRSLVLDIVSPRSKRSCCFTKAYGHYSDGTGSVLTEWNMNDVHQLRMRNITLQLDSEVQINEMKQMQLRYFSPREVARLMCFPEEKEFSFPPGLTTKQKYKLLGNSVNVHVIALLISLLIAGDKCQGK